MDNASTQNTSAQNTSAQNNCTVIVRFTLLNTSVDELLERMNSLMPVIERQDGYLDSTLLVKEGGIEVINMIRWRDRACHDRCQTDPEMIAAGMGLLGLIQMGSVNIGVEIYEPPPESAETR